MDSGAEASSEDEASADAGAAEVGSAQQIRDRNARIRAQAAEDRRSKRDKDRAPAAAPSGLDAAERMDDIFVRSTHAMVGWLTKNFKWLQWVAIIGVLGGFGLQIYRYKTRSTAAASTDSMAVGLVAENGVVRPATDDEKSKLNPELESMDPRPVFATEQARLAAAEAGYRKAMATHPKAGAGWVARLGLAGVLYDMKKWDEALAQYRAVRGSETAKTDPDLLGRSIEGAALCLEAKGDREGALTAYRELTNQESAPYLTTLGLYHQSRLLLADGKKDKAKELLTKAKERLEKEAKEREGADQSSRGSTGYLSQSVKLLEARIDPAAAAAAQTPNLQDVMQQDPAKLQRMLEELRKQPPPVPAPSAPSGT